MDSVETRTVASLWYAWGQIDAGKYPALETDDGFTFQREQQAKAHAYHVAQTATCLPSMMDEWRTFAEGRTAALVLAVNA